MNKRNELLDYHFAQKSIIQNNAAHLRKQGLVKSYRDVYPDIYKRISNCESIAYLRGDVPLKLMALIYDVIVVYIPATSKESIEKRYQLKYEELLSLCEHNIVIPIIGNALEYTAPHFDALFQLANPPYSLWARGLGLLDAFGMSNRLSIAREHLPIDAITQDQKVLTRFQQKLSLPKEDVKKQIADHIAVLYADLCIFGCESDALELNKLPPEDILKRLEMMNEIRTYPILFGLESQPNYNTTKLEAIHSIPISPKNFAPLPVPEKDLEILFEGIGINVDNLTTADIIEYHMDGLGKQLRIALSAFNNYCNGNLNENLNLDIFTVYDKASIFQRQLHAAIKELTPSTYAAIDRTNKHLTQAFQIGTVAIGTLLPIIADHDSPQAFSLSLAGSLGAITLSLPNELAEFVTKLEVSGLQSKFVANMWKAKRVADGKR